MASWPDTLPPLESRAGASEPSRKGEVSSVSSGDRSRPDGQARYEQYERYELLDELGVGGMGRVFAAFDNDLDREVALKQLTVPESDTALAARLANEARLTAKLEHPSIIPVYDAGTSADGHIYYTMRIVRGRSLADAIAEGEDLNARLALLPHFLDACQAVAFANSRDIAHRDLKPDNIMVGSFGETYVVDWGLAASISEARPSAAGTPGFMSPEQAAAQVADQRADVWSLGMTLRVLVGGGRTADTAREASRAEPTPPELDAICARATANQPQDRYQSARELVEDLKAYLAGRRVSAHSYSKTELLARLWRAWRVPLTIAGLALVVVAITGAISWGQMRDERSRARAAESTATTSLSAANNTLAWALEAQAKVALERGDMVTAEIAAAHALTLRESPGARGVLAAVPDRAVLRDSVRFDPPQCSSFVATAIAGQILCMRNDATLLWDVERGSARWTLERHFDMAAVAGSRLLAWTPARGYEIFDTETGERLYGPSLRHAANQLLASPDGRHMAAVRSAVIDVIEPHTGVWSQIDAPCQEHAISIATATANGIAVACADGSVRELDLHGAELWALRAARASAQAPASALLVTDEYVVLGGLDGAVEVLSRRGRGSRPPTKATGGRIAELATVSTAAAAGSDVIAIRPDRGGVILWSLAERKEIARFPEHLSRAMVLGPGPQLALVGALGLRGEVGAPIPRVVFKADADAGLSSAAIHVERSIIAVARGDGVVSAWSLSRGVHLADLQVSRAVVKRLAFSSDGTLLLAAVAGDEGTVAINTTRWQLEEASGRDGTTKRVAVMADDYAVAFGYRNGLSRWKLPAGPVRELASPRFIDITVSPDRTNAALLTASGQVWSMDRVGALVRRFTVPGARAVAIDNAGVFAIVHRRGLTLRRGGSPSEIDSATSDGQDVAFSPDGRLVAVSAQDGKTLVWRVDNGQLLAVLRGHNARVAHVGFSDDGRLFTASWDGSVRIWEMAVLGMSPAALVERARRHWHFDVDEILPALTGTSPQRN